MSQALSSQRSWIARIAVLAMVASLMAFGAAPAGAAIDTSDSCPASIADAGFTDLAGVPAAAVDAINCIADYGISTGTTATTFDPFAEVQRWQMALFITRQATAHGLGSALPAGTDQGFTDLAGVPAAAVTAINQIAELGISTGTSATTFDPFATVERWQMALFLQRLIAIAVTDNVPAVTLPDGSDQGFTDLAGVPAAAVTAINVIAQLDVADGTTATTFDPFAAVERWAMALFLARTLAADGIVPASGTGAVTVTPTTLATLGQNQVRAYSATFANADGSPYTGKVGVLLVEVDTDGTPSYDDDASDATVELVDGVAVNAVEFNGFPGVDGAISFTVRGNANAEKVIPVVWIDADGDNTYEVTTDIPPTEDFGLGGQITFTGAPVAEAVDGNHTDAVVSSVDAAGNSFVADDAAHAPETFNYDDADIFLIGGALSNVAAFEAALTEGDTVQISDYDASVEPGAANTTTYNLTTDTDPTSALKVTVPASSVEVDQSTYLVQGTGEATQLVAIYIDANDNGTKEATEVKVGETTVAAGGAWSVSVPLTQNAANNFVATMRATAATSDTGTGVDVPTITEGAPAAAKLLSGTWTDATPDGLNVGDVITLTFNETITDPDNGDAIEIIDADGTRVRLTRGGNATMTLDATDKIVTITVTLFPEIVTAGSTAGLASPAQVATLTGFVGTDGLDITGPNVLITEAP